MISTTIMHFQTYLDKFEEAADKLNKKLLHKKNIEVSVGIRMDSPCLKLYKKAWASPAQDPVTAESRIFFSVWTNKQIINDQKLFYNIHAFKLRKLPGYKIESRKFADTFRAGFQDFKDQWQNVSIKFGPLTLMEGWLKIDPENFQAEIAELANKFLETAYLIDEALAKFKK